MTAHTPILADRRAANIAAAVNECCEREIARRRGKATWLTPGLNEFVHLLTDIQYAALGVADGLEGAWDEMLRLIGEADYLPLDRALDAAGYRRAA